MLALPQAKLLEHLFAIGNQATNAKLKSKLLVVNVRARILFDTHLLDTSQNRPTPVDVQILLVSNLSFDIVDRKLVRIPNLIFREKNVRPRIGSRQRVCPNVNQGIFLHIFYIIFNICLCPRVHLVGLLCILNLLGVFISEILCDCMNLHTIYETVFFKPPRLLEWMQGRLEVQTCPWR